VSRDALVAVAEHSKARAAALLVAFRIADHTNRAGWSWPSVPVLVEETGYSRSTVLRALTELEDDLEELFVERSRNRRGNRYRLRLPGVPGNALEESADALGTVSPGDRSMVGNGVTRGPERSQIGAGTVSGWHPNRRNLEPSPSARRSSPIGQANCPACGGTGWAETDGGAVVACRCRP